MSTKDQFDLLPRLCPKTETKLLVVLVFTAIAGCSTMGYDSMMMSSLIAVEQFTGYFDVNDVTMGLLNAGVWAGQMVACFFMAYVSDRFGRKKTILYSSILSMIAVAIQTASQNIGMFVFSRFLLGIGIILSCSAGPVLISELAPPNIRGLLCGLYFCMFQVGAIIATAVTYGTVNIDNTWAWRLPSLLQLVPSACVIALLPFTPESPRWKLMKGDVEYATQVLRILSKNEEENIATVQEIQGALLFEQESAAAWREVLTFSKPMIRRFIIGLSLAWLTEMGGSSVGSYYLTVLLKQAGIKSNDRVLQINMISACWNLVVCVAGAFFFDKLGRKKQAFISLSGMIVCFLCLGGFIKKYSTSDNVHGQYATIFWMFLFNAFYAFCYTPLLDIYIPEIFPTRIRVKGLAIQRFFDSGFGLMASFVLSIAMNRLGWKFYIINACYDVLFLPIIYFIWVETKQLSLEQIGEKLGDVKIVDIEGADSSSIGDLEQVSETVSLKK
ncbi:High-affinity glucose transporter [Cyberlindnera fabianii]|uniref:High-affinity glucose transporter n=1 Tax=Cyberlindnera fabianii TaxID=36022 RepID=A0A1V2KZJ4_CYBFA|nr:High-affinity glucose transporter [Cyberlindnera fabianii]